MLLSWLTLMHKFVRIAFVWSACLFAALASPSQTAAPATHTFAVAGNQFVLDGRPYQIISGEMHYTRIPRAYWRDRLRKARAMGLNTISTYVFWNVHEPRPGVYDFSGQNDVAEYLREAQEEGLHVILRPGPYVCAEWDLGGYPSWLLKDRSMLLRSDDPKYIAAMQTWFARLGKEIEPLLLRNGGPIIAVQVENEYGSFGDDHAYMKAVKAALLKNGMGAAVLYTADGPELIPKGSLPELPAVINFGTGEAQKSFAILEAQRPNGPRMSGEYWAGWFDHWGEKHHVTDGQREAEELRWMLSRGYSVNMYMFHGGTSFGWMNGANSNGTNYEPDTTSYDYDAPLDEQGSPRAKFFAFRDVIHRVTGKQPPDLPSPHPIASFPIDAHVESASLWNNLPNPVESDTLLTMEDLDQAYGYILYRARLEKGDGGEIVLDGLHDVAQIYVNQTLMGTLDRRLGPSRLTIPILKQPGTLDILVENSGRVNFTRVLRTERKGITGGATVGGKAPAHWQIFSLPMDDLDKIKFVPAPCTGPCFYRTHMQVDKVDDTFLDTRGVQKGELWLNGRALGRFWSIGPQFALYAPGPWLHEGANELVFFDWAGTATDAIRSVHGPI
ncbi:MAG: beta-galactosidase family protein [Terracidiphilus sp.]